MPNFADPQSLNRYSYTLNNPLKYIDPDGHQPRHPQPGSDKEKGHGGKTLGKGDTSPTRQAPPPTAAPPSAISEATQDKFSVVNPLDFLRMSGFGVRLNGSLWIPPAPVSIFGGDISLDGIYNWKSGEFSLFLTPDGLVGIGAGGDGAGGIIGLYDAADNSAYTGGGVGAQVAVVPELGVQAAWGTSMFPAKDGRHAQIWHLGAAAGGEFSASGTVGCTFEVLRISEAEGIVWRGFPLITQGLGSCENPQPSD